jgi:hypothetical protein
MRCPMSIALLLRTELPTPTSLYHQNTQTSEPKCLRGLEIGNGSRWQILLIYRVAPPYPDARTYNQACFLYRPDKICQYAWYGFRLLRQVKTGCTLLTYRLATRSRSVLLVSLHLTLYLRSGFVPPSSKFLLCPRCVTPSPSPKLFLRNFKITCHFHSRTYSLINTG